MKTALSSKSMNYVKGYVNRWHIVILSILSIISSLMLIAAAYMSKIVIDSIVNNNNILNNIIIALILLVLYAVINGFSKILETKFVTQSTKRLVTDSHNHLLKCSYENATSHHTMEHLKIVSNDAEIAISNYIMLFPTIISMLLKLVAGITLMFIINYKITLIALAMGILVCLIMLVIKKPMKHIHKKVQEKISKSNAYMQESLKNIEVVKALDLTDYVKEGVSNRLELVINELLKKSKFVNIVNSFVYFILEATFIVELVYGGSLIVLGSFLLADFIALISIMEVVKSPFMSITGVSNSIFSMIASSERLMTIIEFKEDSYMKEDFDSIVFEHVSYKYKDNYAIKDLSVKINKNELWGIVGYSGAGKSTFVRLLLGFINPSEGEIYYLKDNKKIERNNTLLKVGYCPQNIALFNDTIYNNLVNGKNIGKERADEVLKFVDLYDDVYNEKNNLDYMLGEGGRGLSQGQMQRLAIARALLTDSNVIILDEPFASLDGKVSKDIFNKLEKLDKTIIIVSHDDFVRDKAENILDLGGRKND